MINRFLLLLLGFAALSINVDAHKGTPWEKQQEKTLVTNQDVIDFLLKLNESLSCGKVNMHNCWLTKFFQTPATVDSTTGGLTTPEYSSDATTVTRYDEVSTEDPTQGYITEISSSTVAPPMYTDGGHPMRVGSITGIPGINFPNYTDIPITSFTCSDKEFLPGFYADLECGCQVFHVCWLDRRESFLCPLGTTFNQALLACDYWYSTNCSLAPHYYNANADSSHSGESKHKDETITAMVSDLLLKGHAHSSFAQTDEKGSKVPDAMSFISQFLPIKAKVVVYPETSGKGAKIVASTSIGEKTVHVFPKEHPHQKMKLPKQHPVTDHPSVTPTLAPELMENAKQDEEFTAVMEVFSEKLKKAWELFEKELEDIKSYHIGKTTPHPPDSTTYASVTETTRKCTHVTTPVTENSGCSHKATTPASVTEKPPKAKQVPKSTPGKRLPPSLPRVDPRFKVTPVVVVKETTTTPTVPRKAMPEKTIPKAWKSAGPKSGKLSVVTKKALMTNILRLLKTKSF